MAFESALNLVWLALGALALGGTIRARVRKDCPCNSAPAWLHVCGVALIVAALFPYISATDDVLRIQHLNIQHDRTHPGKKSGNDELIRLYEAMDTPVLATVPQISPVLVFISLVVTPVAEIIHHCAPLASGRSPPLPV